MPYVRHAILVLAGVLLWLGGLWLLSLQQGRATQMRAWARVQEPAVGQHERAGLRGGTARGQWMVAARSSEEECIFAPYGQLAAGGESFLADGQAHALTPPAPSRTVGRQLVFADLSCGEGGVDYSFARLHRAHVRDDQPVEVARVHLEAEVLEDALASRMRALVQPLLRQGLHRYSQQLQRRSREWGVPGWLLESLHFSEDSRVSVRSANVDFREGRIGVAVALDVDLVVVLTQRTLIRPGRRSPREIIFRVSERVEPLRLVFSLRDWPHIDVLSLEVERRGCEIEGLSLIDQFVDLDRVCNDALAAVLPALEDELAQLVERETNRFVAGIGLEELFVESAANALRGTLEPGRVRTLIEAAGVEVVRAHQDAEGLHASFAVSSQWLGSGESPILELMDGDEPIDLAIRVSLLDRLLEELLSGPADEVLARFSPSLADTTSPMEVWRNVAEELDVALSDDARGNLQQALSLSGLEFAPDFELRPVLSLLREGELQLGFVDARAMRRRLSGGPLARQGETVAGALSLSAAITLRAEETPGGWSFDAKDDLQWAVEAVGEDEQLAMLAWQVQRQLRAQLSVHGLPTLSELLPISLSLPREFSLPTAEISLAELVIEEGPGALVVRGAWRSSVP